MMPDSHTTSPDRTTLDPEGRYVVRGVLGSGAFGVVYRVWDGHRGTEVAAKTVHGLDPRVRQWLKAEYRALRDIVHPNLVKLHELHVDGEHCFFTMDVVDGSVFNQRLDFDRSGSIASQIAAVQRICRAACQLAGALSAVHAHGKCHRDIKPNNVLVKADGEVVLLDFGLSSPVDRSRVFDTARGEVCGTFPYLAPEQYADPVPSTMSDWYSVGVLLYEAIAGDLPFVGSDLDQYEAKGRPPVPLRQRVPAVPDELAHLVLALLAVSPEARPAGRDVVAVLARLGGASPSVGPFPATLRAPEPTFVAREEEIVALGRAYEAALAGRCSIVDIRGPSGIGKTALVRRFVGSLSARRPVPVVFEARCHPQEMIPYKAFDAVVDDLARYWIGLAPPDAEALCPREGAFALIRLFPDLARVPQLDASQPPAMDQGDLRSLRATGFQALRAVIAGVGIRQPVVVWVDDAQWSDPDSLALLDEVFGAREAPPLLLVLSRRMEEPFTSSIGATLSRLAHHATLLSLTLAPLDDRCAASLVRAITERCEGDPAAVEAILREAAGVPYLLSELAYFVVDRQAEDAARSLAAGSLLRERIDALPPEDRTFVELAALAGTAVSTRVLLSAAGRSDRSRLRDLCVMRLLCWAAVGGEALQIYHDRVREFVVDQIPRATTTRHHLALLDAMEAAGTDDAQRLARHAQAAGDRVRTCRYAYAAARQADDALAFDQAARLYQIALDHLGAEDDRAALHEALAEALANAGQSGAAAPEFERAVGALARAARAPAERLGLLQRRAGEQYLKAGHFDDGLRIMTAFLAGVGVTLPRSGHGALAVSAGRRISLYMRGFEFERVQAARIPARVRRRLDDLWAATTALSMMDPVRADGVGLLHFHEALRAGDARHVARSLGYEAAFATLIGGDFLRAKALDLLRRNTEALDADATPYERAFYQLSAGTAAFFQSRWAETVALCDAATETFRRQCRGAEYEAAVALVFSLQALGQAGAVSELVSRIPPSIREADSRGDLFAANNYRAGFHALGRIAAGQIREVQADLRRIVETWRPGFYQMHAYHRVFAGVAVDLYTRAPESALARIESDWPELEAGLFLRMELPAMELRWARARALLGVACREHGRPRQRRLRAVSVLLRAIEGATVAAARPHGAMIRASLNALDGRRAETVGRLREALFGYTRAEMAMHREVARWTLGRLIGGTEGQVLRLTAEEWSRREGVADIDALTATLAPGLEERAHVL